MSTILHYTYNCGLLTFSRVSYLSNASTEVRKQQCKGIVFHLFLIALCSFVPLVDWSCHLGGFTTGIFMGLLIFSFSIRKQRWLVLWGFTGLFFLFMYFIVTMQYLYAYSMDRLALEGEESDSKIMLRDVCAYYESSLDGYECQCSENTE